MRRYVCVTASGQSCARFSKHPSQIGKRLAYRPIKPFSCLRRRTTSQSCLATPVFIVLVCIGPCGWRIGKFWRESPLRCSLVQIGRRDNFNPRAICSSWRSICSLPSRNSSARAACAGSQLSLSRSNRSGQTRRRRHKLDWSTADASYVTRQSPFHHSPPRTVDDHRHLSALLV
jgi:hypothetical protein